MHLAPIHHCPIPPSTYLHFEAHTESVVLSWEMQMQRQSQMLQQGITMWPFGGCPTCITLSSRSVIGRWESLGGSVDRVRESGLATLLAWL